MQSNTDWKCSRAIKVLQRSINLIQGTTLDEIIDGLSPEVRAAIIRHMMDKADNLIREEEEEQAERKHGGGEARFAAIRLAGTD